MKINFKWNLEEQQAFLTAKYTWWEKITQHPARAKKDNVIKPLTGWCLGPRLRRHSGPRSPGGCIRRLACHWGAASGSSRASFRWWSPRTWCCCAQSTCPRTQNMIPSLHLAPGPNALAFQPFANWYNHPTPPTLPLPTPSAPNPP